MYSKESMPLVIKLTADRDIILSSKWDIISILITQNGEEKEGIFSMPALGIHRYSYELEIDKSKYLILDASERLKCYEWELPSGIYEMNIELLFYELIENKKHRMHTLAANGKFQFDSGDLYINDIQ